MIKMKKLFTLFSFFVLAFFAYSNLYGQLIGQRSLNIGGDDYFNVMKPDGGIGMYLGGSTKQSGGSYDAAFVHFSGLGQSAFSYGSAGAELGTYLTTLFDGNVLLTGRSNGFNGTSNQDVFLTKINPATGSVIWSKTFGTDSIDFGIKAINSLDSNILVTGVTGNSKTDMLLLKVASNDGHLIFAKKIGLPSSNEVPYEIQELKDFIVPGLKVIAIMGYSDIGFLGSNDISITVLDITGGMFMQMFYGGSGSDEGKAGILTPAGYIYVAGNTSGYGAGGQDFFVMKLYAGGGMPVINWFKTYGGSNNDTLTGFERNKGGFLLGGNTQSFGTGGDGLLVQIDTNGNVLWTRNEGSTGKDAITGILSDPFTNLNFSIGYSNSFNGGSNNDGLFIIADSAGYSGTCDGIPAIVVQTHTINDSIEFPSINFTSDSVLINVVNTNITAVTLTPVFSEACPSVFGIASFEKDVFNVFPNPFTENITVSAGFSTSYSIELFDISARLVYQSKSNTAETEINLTNVQPGIYTLVCSDGKTAKRTKIVKF
jgi:hypothetical protein